MALDREKTFRDAERMLRQGKVQAAVALLQRLADEAPGDLVSLNRAGDMLARAGKRSEAILYYRRTADQFANAGFVPKAIAIFKKILRMEPGEVEALTRLGELYVQQRLAGEARAYLRKAADRCHASGDHEGARRIFARLVTLEPSLVEYRLRLAESTAAAGRPADASRDLAAFGQELVRTERDGDAEIIFRKAMELQPGDPAAVAGLASVMARQGKWDDAVGMLEKARRGGDDPALAGELLVLYEQAGRREESRKLIEEAETISFPEQALERVLRHHQQAGTPESAWEILDAALERMEQTGDRSRAEKLLDRLAGTEENGHIPALERLSEARKDAGERLSLAGVLERLVEAYRSRSMHDEASLALERLAEVAPASSLLREDKTASEPEEAPAAPKQETPAGAAVEDVAAEAPAVPLNRADEEFVNGRMTQAEILEKYGLRDQALEQVRTVVERFPGHVPAQERLVAILREKADDKPALRDALVGLALARRAAGDSPRAVEQAEEAARVAPLDAATRQRLERLHLLPEGEGDEVASAPEASPEPVAEESAGSGQGEEASGAREPVEETAAVPAESLEDATACSDAPRDEGAPEEEAVSAASEMESTETPVPVEPPEGEIEIEFEAGVTEEEPEEALSGEPAEVAADAPSPEEPRGPGHRVPEPDVLAEISSLLESGRPAEAARRIAALRTLGYGGAALDRLETKVPDLEPAPAEEGSAPDEADDLGSITAALEAEMFEEDEPTPAPAAESEEDLEEVFRSFKEHVEQEVGSGDFRTHYDLGIAYKEMGLLEDAIGEFRFATAFGEIAREAWIMLGVCYRELGRLPEAADSFREALNLSGTNAEQAQELRYNLADVLAALGDRDSALGVFSEIAASNPDYRDVRDRISALQAGHA